MFWLGFIGIYVVFGLFVVGILLFNNIVEKVFNGMKVVFCTTIFTMVTFVLSLFYSILSIALGSVITSAFFCSIFLVFTWILAEKMYQLMSGNEVVLTEKDKNICHLLAMLGVILSAIILMIKNSDKEYGILISISVSIWIGAYVPLSSIYKGKKMKELLGIVIDNFREGKITVWLTGVIITSLILLLISSNEIVNKLNLIITKVGQGIGFGSVSMIVILIVIGICRDKLKK